MKTPGNSDKFIGTLYAAFLRLKFLNYERAGVLAVEFAEDGSCCNLPTQGRYELLFEAYAEKEGAARIYWPEGKGCYAAMTGTPRFTGGFAWFLTEGEASLFLSAFQEGKKSGRNEEIERVTARLKHLLQE